MGIWAFYLRGAIMNEITNVFKLLSDESRLRMLVLLYKQELCVCEMTGVLNLPQSRVSKNLARLRDLNLVKDERREKFVFYTLKTDNSLLIKSIELILDQIDRYPQIKADFDRLNDKEKYLNQCTTQIQD